MQAMAIPCRRSRATGIGSGQSERLASASNDRTVKVWDTGNGEFTGKAIFNVPRVSIDTTGLYLYTGIGTIAIDASTALNNHICQDVNRLNT
jgi:hypothetical protein